jgi:hypothetical protein
MSAFREERTWPTAVHMSANDPKRTFLAIDDHVLNANALPFFAEIKGHKDTVWIRNVFPER